MVFAQSSRSVLAIDLDQTSRAAQRPACRGRTPAVRAGPTGGEPPSNDPNGSPGRRLSCTTCRRHPRTPTAQTRRATLINADLHGARLSGCLLALANFDVSALEHRLGPHHGSTGDRSPKRSRTRRQRQFAARKYFSLRGLFVGLYASFPGVRLFFGEAGVLVGRLMGLSGRMCPKRRGLKPRWPGYLQETMR